MPRVRETQGSWPFAPHHYFPWQFLSLQQTLWDADELYNTIFCRQNQVRVSFSQSVTPEDSCLLAGLLAACCYAEGGLKVFLLFPSPSRFVYATRGPRVQRPHYWWNCRRNSLVRTNYYSKYVCRCCALLAGGTARQWLPTSTRGCCCCCFWLLLWDRVASLPQIVMTTAWQLGFFTATRCHHHGMVIKNIIQMFVKMLYLVFHKFLIFEFN